MSETLVQITEKWTWRLGPFILKSDGDPIDLSGLTVVVKLRDANQQVKVFAGVLEVDPDQTANKGHVYITPVEADFVAGKYPYRARFKVTDADGQTVYFPNGQAMDLAVWPE